MRLVRENIDFKRGQKPKKSLGIGREEMLKRDPKYLMDLLVKEIDEIDSWRNFHDLNSSNPGTFFLVWVKYSKPYSRKRISVAIYNWLFENANYWDLKEISELELVEDLWKNVISFKRNDIILNK